MANHEQQNWLGVPVKRGQVVTGLRSLNEATGLSTQTLRTCLSRLEKAGNLTSRSTNRFRILTLCNYDTYQISDGEANKPANNPLTSQQQASNKPATANKNVKNDKNEKNVKNEKKKRKLIYKIEYPPELDTLEFQASWQEWIQHRTEIKKKLTPSTISKQLKMLSKYPPATAIAMIEQSICGGWTGIFELKDNYERNPIKPQKRTDQGQASQNTENDSDDYSSFIR